MLRCLPACLAPVLACLACRFDDVFHESVDNSQLYEQAVQPLVGTIFRWVLRQLMGGVVG